MEIFGIGTSELLFILILALIILGPKDMQKAGRTIGKWLRSIVTSDGWMMIRKTSNELRTLPNRLMREANEELGKVGDVGKELKDTADLISDRNPRVPVSTTRFQQAPVIVDTPGNKIEPPAPSETKVNESDPNVDA
jgi:Sec-independent protein translocase protein TatA